MLKLEQQHKDLISTFINQLWSLFSGPLVMLLIPIFLSQEQQGYWYLFRSLAALSIFADLGFSNIILQFSAHEFAFLHFNPDGSLDGDSHYLKKLGSFLRFVIKWLSAICAVVFPVIFFVGIFFFVRDKVIHVYLLPWIIFTTGSLFSFFCNSILSFIEGLNKIEQIQKIRFRIALINTVFIMGILALRGNIYALSFAMFASGLLLLFFLIFYFRKTLLQLFKISYNFTYNWRIEIIPLFVRYALSFASGYFIFQIYTPLMHYFHGPVFSGKVGISLSLVMAASNMSNIWIYTITPRMNMLISKKDWKTLDSLFIKRALLSLGTYIFVILGLIIFLLIFGNFWIIPKIISRFLPVNSLIILFSCYFIQLLINAWALYLRGHKQEPYVVPSIISGIWIAITTFFAGKYLSPAWFFSGFLSSYFFGLPVCYLIFKKCKGKWHG